MIRAIRWSVGGLLALLLVAWGVFWLGEHAPASPAGAVVREVASLLGAPVTDDGVPAGVAIGGPFTLTDPAGHTVTDRDYRGKFMLVYFGYTFCPDVCPTELQAVAAALNKLGPNAEKLAPIFVTIDPERDTPTVMGNYVKLFDPRLIGLTGTPAEIHDIATAYRVYYAKAPQKGDPSAYLMDHSSFMYLMGPDGKFRALLQPGESPDEIASRIQAEMQRAS